MLCRLCRCPYGWLSACCPLLLEGRVGGGEARGGSDEGSAATGEEKNTVITNFYIFIGQALFVPLPPRTPPSRRRGPRWVLSPPAGVTCYALHRLPVFRPGLRPSFNAGARLPSFGGAGEVPPSLYGRRLGALEQPSIWLRPHKGERIPHSRRGSWGVGLS